MDLVTTEQSPLSLECPQSAFARLLNWVVSPPLGASEENHGTARRKGTPEHPVRLLFGSR